MTCTAEAISRAASGLQFGGCRMRDWPELASVVADCFPLADDAEIGYHLMHHRSGIRLLRIDGRIAAFAINDPSHGQSAWLEMLGVAPAFRQRGLGRHMLRDYETFVAGLGYRRIEFAVDQDNIAAIAMYEACGYARLPRAGERLTYFRAITPTTAAMPPDGRSHALIRALRRLSYRLLVKR